MNNPHSDAYLRILGLIQEYPRFADEEPTILSLTPAGKVDLRLQPSDLEGPLCKLVGEGIILPSGQERRDRIFKEGCEIIQTFQGLRVVFCQLVTGVMCDTEFRALTQLRRELKEKSEKDLPEKDKPERVSPSKEAERLVHFLKAAVARSGEERDVARQISREVLIDLEQLLGLWEYRIGQPANDLLRPKS